MGVRTWLNENPAIATGAAALLLVVMLGMLFLQMRGPQHDLPQEVYFLDLDTNELFAGPRDASPPVEAPSGGLGVRAHVHTCGECTPEQWFGHLELDADIEAHRQALDGPIDLDEGDVLLRDLEGGPWVSYESEAAFEMFERLAEPCPGTPDVTAEQNPCLP